ncbi:MAG: nitrile hydratase accessory protein [Rhizobiaceae bacterium]
MSKPEQRPDLRSLPDMVLDGDEPVFNAPWEAQAFALTLGLYEKGLFGWEEWAASLSAEIHSGVERDYYRHWLVALEQLVAKKQLTSPQDIDAREQAWHDAAARTPHGEPIEL